MSGAPRPAEPPRGHSAPQEPPPAAGAGAGSGAGEASGEPPSEPDSPGGAQGDKPETRSVCSSESGSGSQPGGAGPICKICFQGPEQVRRGGAGGQHQGQGSAPPQRPAG